MVQRDIPRPITSALLVVALGLFISIGARSAVSWKYWGDLDHNSPGTWLCMAGDLRDGMLYRPVESDLGYGGTRYTPLFPVIISVFMRLGFAVVTSGFLAGLIAAAVTLTGLFALMRRLYTPALIAAALSLFILAATCTRTIILGIKGDLLPVGLNLWGLALVIRATAKRESALALIASAICFTLAMTAKITSVFGIASAILWLLFRGKSRQAANLSLIWLGCFILAALIIQSASGGRALAIFLASASGGGTSARFLKGPRLLLADLAHNDRTLLGLLGIAVFLIAATRRWMSLPAILLLISTAGTILIYGSPGTHLNHLVDMNASAILVIATHRLKTRKFQAAIFIGALLLITMAAAACWRQMSEMRPSDFRGQMLAAITDTQFSSRAGPVLSENPLLPMLVGERPYMLDPFEFRAIRARHPLIANKFWRDLDGRHFKAVILHGPPSDPGYSSNEYDFGPGFIDRLKSQYAQKSVHGNFYVFLPK